MILGRFNMGLHREVRCENPGCRSENVVITGITYRDLYDPFGGKRVRLDMSFRCEDCGFTWNASEDILIRPEEDWNVVR